MKIVKVETVRSTVQGYCWILVYTDTGLVGIGETHHGAHGAEAFIHEYASSILLGSNPEDIEKIWQQMYKRASLFGFMGAELRAISCIDLALWDLLGKALDRPLYRILGGQTRDQVPIYYSGIYDPVDMKKDEVQDWSKKCVDAGWTACKTARFFGDFYGDTAGYISAANAAEGARRFEWAREAVGDQMEIGIDLHCSFDVPSAIRIGRAIKPFNPYFMEEPIQPHNPAALREVRESSGVPIAAGERILSRWGFREIIESNAADVLNPDIAWAGGISELRKIATYAETHYIPMAPHNYGPFSCLALTHLMAVIPNTRHLEHTPQHYTVWNNWLDEPIEWAQGHLPLPQRPGLGRELSAEVLALPRTTIEAD